MSVESRLAALEQEMFSLRALTDQQGSQSVLAKGTEMANPVLITPGSYTSVGQNIAAFNAQLSNSAVAWPAANRAVFVPFFITQVETVRKMFTYNNVVADSIDVGIYQERYDGTVQRVVANGGTAMSGADRLQEFSVQNLVLKPGRYYMAMSTNSTTSIFWYWNIAGFQMKAIGCAQMASAYPLPDVATLAACATSTFLPVFGVSFRDLVA